MKFRMLYAMGIVSLAMVFATGAATATITLTLTNAQVAKINRAFQVANADLALQTPPGTPWASAQEYGAAKLNACIDDVIIGLDARDRETDCATFRAATQTQRDSACAAVGRPAPCSMGCR